MADPRAVADDQLNGGSVMQRAASSALGKASTVPCAIRLWLAPAVAHLLLFAPAASAATIDWVTVGDPGNACEVQSQGCFGTVTDVYRIGKYEVTNSQYVEFLNAVAATDPNGVYPGLYIAQSGTSGSFTYSVAPTAEDWPVSQVSFYDALRFANWMHNGQPTGAQSNATTEDGAYTITPAGIAANSIVRNAGASIYLTSEDEWYKAAYYDAISTTFFDYPGASNAPMTCNAPTGAANSANCGPALGQVAPVGSYPGSPGPYGAFDQGGNVLEWNEAAVGLHRVARGGHFFSNQPVELNASVQTMYAPLIVSSPPPWAGFRLASPVPVPEPGTGLLLMFGLVGLTCRRFHIAL